MIAPHGRHCSCAECRRAQEPYADSCSEHPRGTSVRFAVPAVPAPSEETVYEQVQVPVCRGCDGDGWYVGHEAECYETGDCTCSGVQMPCEMCGGTGAVQ